MKTKEENYTKFMLAGLIITVLVIVGLMLYWFGETTRLAQAAEEITNERVDRGRQIYNDQCSSCHGGQGEGGVGPALNDKKLLKNTLDNVFFSVIRSGVPNTQMPAWSVDYGGPLTDEDVRDVVAFMRAWEPTAPEIEPATFEPDAGRGALLFSNTCAVCHGENGLGSEKGPKINDQARLASFDDEWYREVIKNGRPAKGMPTWGTVLSPNQVEDLVALINTWRLGEAVRPSFDVTQLLDSAIFSLENDDPGSALLQIQRSLASTQGPAQEILLNVEAQLQSGDNTGALATVKALRQQWPMGDATNGAVVYAKNCAPCHGPNGEGGIGKQLSPNEFIQSLTNAEIVQFLNEGRAGTAMAGFKDRLDDTQLADVTTFMRLWQP